MPVSCPVSTRGVIGPPVASPGIARWPPGGLASTNCLDELADYQVVMRTESIFRIASARRPDRAAIAQERAVDPPYDRWLSQLPAGLAASRRPAVDGRQRHLRARCHAQQTRQC